jgi:hypothetical protein
LIKFEAECEVGERPREGFNGLIKQPTKRKMCDGLWEVIGWLVELFIEFEVDERGWEVFHWLVELNS